MTKVTFLCMSTQWSRVSCLVTAACMSNVDITLQNAYSFSSNNTCCHCIGELAGAVDGCISNWQQCITVHG